MLNVSKYQLERVIGNMLYCTPFKHLIQRLCKSCKLHVMQHIKYVKYWSCNIHPINSIPQMDVRARLHLVMIDIDRSLGLSRFGMPHCKDDISYQSHHHTTMDHNPIHKYCSRSYDIRYYNLDNY